MACARVPLVGRRFGGHVEVGEAEDNGENLVPGSSGLYDLVSLWRQRPAELLDLVHADDDFRRGFGGRRGSLDGTKPKGWRGCDAPMNASHPPSAGKFMWIFALCKSSYLHNDIPFEEIDQDLSIFLLNSTESFSLIATKSLHFCSICLTFNVCF